ncbi:DEKNAAC103726 [Brettanomyces naardenensis]|uniref:DEKNAAC103726 n=1 Tax=Brettanomyces naardenensis TaxID=13370 RepID=A0A448YNH3_BRENA|nr:DEKNAAC103726 [Brettanomyces naardenensis]
MRFSTLTAILYGLAFAEGLPIREDTNQEVLVVKSSSFLSNLMDSIHSLVGYEENDKEPAGPTDPNYPTDPKDLKKYWKHYGREQRKHWKKFGKDKKKKWAKKPKDDDGEPEEEEVEDDDDNVVIVIVA